MSYGSKNQGLSCTENSLKIPWLELEIQLMKLFFRNLPKIYMHFKGGLKLRLFQKLYLEF